MPDFTNKRVMITGAGGGIGTALAAHFASLGASLLLMDRSDAMLDGARGLYPKARFAAADMTDRDALRRAVVALGEADVLINNAGVAASRSLKKTTDETFDLDIDANLKGTFHLTMAVAEGMKARRAGSIVNISTANASISVGHPPYSAAKAAMVSLTRTMAVEFGPFGIRVNAVAPGTVRTPAWQDRVTENPNILDEVGAWYPLRRVAWPEEVAKVVAFVASDDASIITGALIPADCGLTAGLPPAVRMFSQEDI